MMRLTPLSLAANTIFYLILAVMYCRVLTRRFSWPVTLLGLTVGYLLYIIPTKFMPYADAERMLFGLVTFPLTPIVLFRNKWYQSLLCAFAGLVAMVGSDLLSVSWLLTPEQLRQGLTFQPIPVQLAVYAIFLSTDGLLMFLFTLLMNRYQNRLSGREWALYLAFPASQYLLIYGWVIFLRTDFILRRVLMLLLALAICTAADALLFTAIRGMAQRSELKARNDLLARQIDRQNEHYAALTAQYENLRRIRHDISSHLYTMQLLLQEGSMTRRPPIPPRSRRPAASAPISARARTPLSTPSSSPARRSCARRAMPCSCRSASPRRRASATPTWSSPSETSSTTPPRPAATPERSVFLSRPAWTAASCASRSATRPLPRPHGTAAASRSWSAASARTSSARWRRPMRAATRSRRPAANARPAFF